MVNVVDSYKLYVSFDIMPFVSKRLFDIWKYPIAIYAKDFDILDTMFSTSAYVVDFAVDVHIDVYGGAFYLGPRRLCFW